MKKILYFALLIALSLNSISCSKDDPEDGGIENNGSTGNGNNNNGNNNGNSENPHKGISFTSSHSLNIDKGFVTGDANATIYNRSSDKITSVKLVVKSQNQSSYEVQSWSEIKGDRDVYSKKINFNKTQYPVLICTYTYKGQKYSQEYTY